MSTIQKCFGLALLLLTLSWMATDAVAQTTGSLPPPPDSPKPGHASKTFGFYMPKWRPWPEPTVTRFKKKPRKAATPKKVDGPDLADPDLGGGLPTDDADSMEAPVDLPGLDTEPGTGTPGDALSTPPSPLDELAPPSRATPGDEPATTPPATPAPSDEPAAEEPAADEPPATTPPATEPAGELPGLEPTDTEPQLPPGLDTDEEPTPAPKRSSRGKRPSTSAEKQLSGSGRQRWVSPAAGTRPADWQAGNNKRLHPVPASDSPEPAAAPTSDNEEQGPSLGPPSEPRRFRPAAVSRPTRAMMAGGGSPSHRVTYVAGEASGANTSPAKVTRLPAVDDEAANTQPAQPEQALTELSQTEPTQVESASGNPLRFSKPARTRREGWANPLR